MKKLAVLTVLGVLLIGLSSQVYSQEEKFNPTNFWINAGLGATNAGIAITASINYPIADNSQVTLRYSYNEEFKIFVNGESVWDLGLMYGYSTQSEYFQGSVSAGIALTGGAKLGKYIPGPGWFSGRYEELPYLTIGLPAEIQLFWRPFRFMGIGFTLFGNFNAERSFGGVQAGLQFGSF